MVPHIDLCGTVIVYVCFCVFYSECHTGFPLGPSSPGRPRPPEGPAVPGCPASPFSPRSPRGPCRQKHRALC